MAINLEQLRRRLDDERNRLANELEKIRGDSQSGDVRREGSPFGKREEEATESFELEKRLALEKQIKADLAKVEHAIDKMKEGTYGLCDLCQQPIGLDRLEAIPEANLCLGCKAKQSRTGTSRDKR